LEEEEADEDEEEEALLPVVAGAGRSASTFSETEAACSSSRDDGACRFRVDMAVNWEKLTCCRNAEWNVPPKKLLGWSSERHRPLHK